MSAAAKPHFAVPLGRTMRRQGLAGSTAEIRLEGDALVLSGAAGGRMVVSAREVECIRIARLVLPPTRHSTGPPRTIFETRIWQTGRRAPLLIGPPTDRSGDYREVMREFAGWVFTDGGDVFRGPGLATLVVEMVWAIVPLALFGLVLLGGAIVEDLVWLWLLAAFVLALPYLLARRTWRRHWPRRVSRPEELDVVLPPSEESRI